MILIVMSLKVPRPFTFVCVPLIKNHLTDAQKQQYHTDSDSVIIDFKFIPVFDINQTTGEHILETADFVTERLMAHEEI